jgi:hypothetical protein
VFRLLHSLLDRASSVQSDLYQHRLWLGDSGSWEDILVRLGSPCWRLDELDDAQIPFADFALTNSGQVAEQQVSMMREKVRTVGISVMLPVGAAGGEQVVPLDQDHPFDLGIES